MTPRKIIKWTLAIGDEDDICLPFSTSVDTDTYGNSEAVNVVDIAVVFNKLITPLNRCVGIYNHTNLNDTQILVEMMEVINDSLKLADIIMDESKDTLGEGV